MKLKLLMLCTLSATLSLSSLNATACTGFQLKAQDNSVVNGRTVEFGLPIVFFGLIIPRHYSFQGTLPDGTQTGLKYQAKYAVVGAATFNAPAIMDGLNEKGLSVGAFYFPGFAGYTTITAENKAKALAPTEFNNWLLTQFANVDEIKAGLNAAIIAPTPVKDWGGVPPFHYVVYDRSGKSIVIEPVNGTLKVYDNPLGVITNSPDFPWHLTNLTYYINLSTTNAAPLTINGYKLQQFGQGSGLHGLPGDFTPASRFVRAALFSNAAIPSDHSPSAVFQAFHLLNQFDLPLGSLKEVNNGKVYFDYTLATTVKDPQTTKYYFKTYNDQTIKFIDLTKFDLNATKLKHIPMMTGKQVAVDVSNMAT